MNTERKQVLRSVAAEVLNLEGQREVEDHLVMDELDRAENYILGGLDACVQREMIDMTKAAELYQQLGVDVDRAARMRQAHNSF